MSSKGYKRVISINDYDLPPKQTRSHASQSAAPVPQTPEPTVSGASAGSITTEPVPPTLATPQPIGSTRVLRSATKAASTSSTSVAQPGSNATPQSNKPTKKASSKAKKSTKSKPQPAPTAKSDQNTTLPDGKMSSEAPHQGEPPSATSAPTDSSAPGFFSDEAILERQKAYMVQEAKWVKAQEKKDPLMQRPPPGFSYITKRGDAYDDGRFAFSKPIAEHPKIREADRKGTLTREKQVWYQGMPHSVNVPVAGVPSEKTYFPRFPPGHPQSYFEDSFHTRPSIKLIVPDILKAMLVDDWENITKNNQLVPLPHPHPVTKILEDYAAYEAPKRPAGSSHVDILEETLAGLKEYFDKSLGRILLYRFERAQYAEMYKKWMSDDPEYQGKTASDTYGPEHLLRLLVSLPELVAQTNMDQQSVNRLREELVKFCTWLSKNTTEYFVSHYESPPQDYIQKAKD